MTLSMSIVAQFNVSEEPASLLEAIFISFFVVLSSVAALLVGEKLPLEAAIDVTYLFTFHLFPFL